MESSSALTAPQIDLLVVQPTGFCNIDCSYCYLPGRDLKNRMADRVATAVIEKAIQSERFVTSSLLLWHAGEPMAVPIGWYKNVYAEIAAVKHGPIRSQFQTNGTLIDHKWAEFFKENQVSVGLSIDGPSCVHDYYRKDRKANGTLAQAIAGAEVLKSHQIPFTVISTVTDQSLLYPNEIYDLMEELQPASWGLSVEEAEGDNAISTVYNEPATDKIVEFFFKIAKRNFASITPLRIREIDSTLHALQGPSEGSQISHGAGNQENTLGAIVSIGHDGSVTFFSPELLTSLQARESGSVVGNILTSSIEELITNGDTLRIKDAISAGVETCRRSCEYFDFCGGGSPANKLMEGGRYDIAETWQCKVSKQAVTRGILSALSAH